MKPDVALAGKVFDGVEEIRALYKEWTEAYGSIANEYPLVKDRAEMLTERIKCAYELFVDRDRQTNTACDALDGDFPLGNEKDMLFASRRFSVRELALIQLGLSHTIDLDATVKHVPVDFVRKGFLLELEGRFSEAAKTYRPACFFRSGELYDRVQECRKKAKAERKTDTDVYYIVTVNYLYTYDKEGRTKEENGEDFYDLEEGAIYSLPYMHDSKMEILSVSVDSDTVTAQIRVGGDTVTISNKGEPTNAYTSGEYSVFGDCVHERLSMAIAIKKE